jgi:poly-D-alanine transfer protein DltD
MPSYTNLARTKHLIESACALFVALGLFTLGPASTAAIAQEPTPVSASQASIPQEAFSHQIAERIERVPEFKFIREEAARLGVKAYLFGGTAAGYAHYVKWDMQREAGDKRFQPDRFDYDYTNIYRSTQDLDIVVDGPPEAAAALQSSLSSTFPHLQGSKTAWEVRLLRQDMGDKQALLNNPDFLNQHTDSNSTGMIEISKPTAGEPVIRDLRDWESKNPYFLRDVMDGKIHYYFSPSHGTTTFAKQGRNPPIISVIRFLTKAFQYELEIRPEDLKQIKSIIDAFQPNGPEMSNSYVRNWLLNKDNGRKLIQNAVNIEYAWDTLEKLGLRKKLISIENNPDTIGSLAWWMNKEPLRTRKIGSGLNTGLTGKGRTARELGLDIVAHETNSFLAYESITRAHTGDPNVLISRVNTAGEGAAYGNGFYTRIGREGARGTGLTIRFHLDSNAREGADFSRAGDFVIVHNKSALRVIPESLNFDPVQYFEMLSEGKAFSNSDLGLLEKLKRRTSQSVSRLSPQDQEKIVSIVRQDFAKPNPNTLLFQTWFSFPIAIRHPEILGSLLERGTADPQIAQFALTQPEWKNHPEFVEKIIKSDKINPEWIAKTLLQMPHWKEHPELVEKLIDSKRADATVVQFILSQPEWRNRPDLIKTLLERGTADPQIAQFVLTQPEWKNHPEFVEKIIRSDKINPEWIAKTLLQMPHWKEQPELVEKLIDSKRADATVVQFILSQPEWRNRPDLIKTLLERGTADPQIAQFVLTQPEWKNHPQFVEKIIKSDKINPEWIAKTLLQLPHWKEHPELVEKLIDSKKADQAVVQYLLSQPELSHRHDLIEKLLNNGTVDSYIVEHVLSQPEWRNRPDLIAKLLERGTADVQIAQFVLTQPEWKNHPEFVEKIIKSDKINPEWIAKTLLQMPHWKEHPELVEKLIDSKRADATAVQFILSQPEWRNRPDLIKTLLERGTADPQIAQFVLTQPEWKDHPQFVEKLIKSDKIIPEWIAKTLLQMPHWKEHPELVEKLIDSKKADQAVVQYLLSQPELSHRHDLIEKLLNNGTVDSYIVQHVLSQPEPRNRPDLIAKLLERGTADPQIAQFVLTQPEWKNHPEFVEKLFQSKTLNPYWIAKDLLSLPHWKEHPELVEKLIDSKKGDAVVAQFILSQPEWRNRPDLVKTLLERGTADAEIAEYVLTQPAWKNHPELVEKLIENKKINPQWLETNLLQLPHWKDHPKFDKKFNASEKVVSQKEPEIPASPPSPQRNISAESKKGNCVVRALRRLFQ